MSLLDGFKDAKTVLVLRTDAIGDNVLGSGILPALRAAVPETRIVYACQDRVAELFGACPFVDEVIPFSRGRACADEAYRSEVAARLAAVAAGAVLNPVFSREVLADNFVRDCGATIRVGFSGANDSVYTHLISPAAGWRGELERAGEFAAGLGIGGVAAVPQVWLTGEDEAFARECFAKHRLDAGRTVVLYAGALAEYRVNRNIGRALALAFPEGEMRVVCLGAAHEFALHEELLAAYPGSHVNLCGRTTLLQTAAILKYARLAVGAETGAVHLACAVGTQNVAVVGGGHFGRFVPWSPLTAVACLPLACFGCDWKCKHTRHHCVTDIGAETIATAITQAANCTSAKPRIVAQKAVGLPEGNIGDWVDTRGIELTVSRKGPGPGAECMRITKPFSQGAAITSDEFRVTAIVSTYASESYMRGCLQDLVEQTLFEQGQLEILVIDSASPQNEGVIVREFQEIHGTGRIRYHRSPKRETLYASWNLAIDLARGAYLTNANTDDHHHPEMLERLAAALDARAECVLAYCDTAITHDANASWRDARRVRVAALPEYTRERLFAESFVGPHPMWRKEVHRIDGYFDPAFVSAGDYEFWLRLSLRSTFVHVPETLGLMYENKQGISLGNMGLTWYEVSAARQRYWKKEWGADPATRDVCAAFGKLAVRLEALPEGSRVALLGAGQHTGRHLARFRQGIEPRGDLVAILDDRPSTIRALAGIPIMHADQWRGLALDAIVVSSDTYEAALAARAMKLTGGTIPVFAVYQSSLDHQPAMDHRPLAEAIPVNS